MSISDNLFRRNENIAWRVIEGEALIVDTKKGFIYPLNEVATRVWESLDGRNSVNDIAAAIGKEFDCGRREEILQDIASFIEDGIKSGVLESCG